MNSQPSPILLLGVGGAGTAMVRGILRSYGPGIRALAIDTDAQSGGTGDMLFLLLGGNRLAGRGTGGQPASARAAFQDTPSVLDSALEGVRTVVIVTALGGGTGGGATGEILKHLHTLGIATLVFATIPFSFEGAERSRTARTSIGSIEQHADVSVFLPLDELVAGANTDNMRDALAHGIDTMSLGVTLLWRVLEKPGYIKFDPERLRTILSGCGRAQFATATAMGPNRADDILASLSESPLLKQDANAAHVRTLLVGVLAGDDLRLSEVGIVASGLSAAFGLGATLELGTVNDEDTFSGRLTVVVLIFNESATATKKTMPGTVRHAVRDHAGERALARTDRFRHSDATMWNDEDLDIPTFIRRQLTLDR